MVNYNGGKGEVAFVGGNSRDPTGKKDSLMSKGIKSIKGGES